ncbi:hypothetical protein GCM10009624_04050 [Gordonia sinesedis]
MTAIPTSTASTSTASMSTGSSAPSASGVRLSVSALRAVGECIGVGGWPVVLDLDRLDADSGLPDTGAERPGTERPSGNADRGGFGSGVHLEALFAHGEPIPVVDTVVGVLTRPDRQIEARTFRTDGTITRLCLARRGAAHVLAVRERDEVDLRIVDIPDAAALGSVIRRHCADRTGVREPLSFTGFGHPSDELADRLRPCGTTHDLTDALHAIGAAAADAAIVATALADIRARTEIVAVARDEPSAGVPQSSGAIGVFDTHQGRILASPSRSPDGRVWTTFSPGSGHRIAQATGLLIETLPDGRWF